MYKKTEMESTTLKLNPTDWLSVMCGKEGKQNPTAAWKQSLYMHLGWVFRWSTTI